RENARTALAVLSRLDAGGVPIGLPALREGFARVRWPGRLEPCPSERRLWWDGAHNVEGVRRLCLAWADDLGLSPPGAVVFAAGRDKAARAMRARLRALAPAAALFVTRTHSERALSPEELVALADNAGWEAEAAASVAEAIEVALAGAGTG